MLALRDGQQLGHAVSASLHRNRPAIGTCEVSTIAGTIESMALSSFSTSVPLRMSGFVCGTFTP